MSEDPPSTPGAGSEDPQSTPSASSSKTPSTAGATETKKPPKPIMGGLVALVKDEWSAWTGGMPNHTWTGLEVEKSDNTSPYQLRPAFASASQKGYTYRRTGTTTKFTPASDLSVFQNTVWKHLTGTGMDAIAYLKDPEVEAKMSNVVKSHARYTVVTAKALSEEQSF